MLKKMKNHAISTIQGLLRKMTIDNFYCNSDQKNDTNYIFPIKCIGIQQKYLFGAKVGNIKDMKRRNVKKNSIKRQCL
jgi:hypothetical protein